MKFVFGTTNEAKLKTMQEILSVLPVEIIGINALLSHIPAVDESGSDPLENAIIKATAYYQTLRVPVFSCDSGLFIEGIEDSMQPGVHVRNVNGKQLQDGEMIAHYTTLAKKLGGQCHAVYRNAICLIYDEHHVYTDMSDDLSGESFIISSIPHPKRRVGFPLDSLSIHAQTGKYYFDIEEERGLTTAQGFVDFFTQVLHSLKVL